MKITLGQCLAYATQTKILHASGFGEGEIKEYAPPAPPTNKPYNGYDGGGNWRIRDGNPQQFLSV